MHCVAQPRHLSEDGSTHLVADDGGPGAHFEALRRQIPVRASTLACQLQAARVALLHDLAQAKVLRAGSEPCAGIFSMSSGGRLSHPSFRDI